MHVSASGSAIAEGRADANKIKTAGKEVVAGNRNSWKFEAMKRADETRRVDDYDALKYLIIQIGSNIHNFTFISVF